MAFSGGCGLQRTQRSRTVQRGRTDRCEARCDVSRLDEFERIAIGLADDDLCAGPVLVRSKELLQTPLQDRQVAALGVGVIACTISSDTLRATHRG